MGCCREVFLLATEPEIMNEDQLDLKNGSIIMKDEYSLIIGVSNVGR